MVLSAAAATAQPVPVLVPGDTIRRVRLFHNLTRAEFAQSFGVTERTVFRWERDGVEPDALQLDPGARSGPEWRRKYMNWLLDRYEAAHVSDSRKKEG